MSAAPQRRWPPHSSASNRTAQSSRRPNCRRRPRPRRPRPPARPSRGNGAAPARQRGCCPRWLRRCSLVCSPARRAVDVAARDASHSLLLPFERIHHSICVFVHFYHELRIFSDDAPRILIDHLIRLSASIMDMHMVCWARALSWCAGLSSIVMVLEVCVWANLSPNPSRAVSRCSGPTRGSSWRVNPPVSPFGPAPPPALVPALQQAPTKRLRPLLEKISAAEVINTRRG